MPHRLNGDDLFRGEGAEAKKSAPLLSVSTQPLADRKTARTLEAAGAGPEPSKHEAELPYPTRSTIVPVDGHAPERFETDRTKAS